ncbi:MAG: anhydro-N-acetylmuramic acid kinase [Planctomycetota bacterium]
MSAFCQDTKSETAAVKKINAIISKPRRLVAGLLSGTSADAIDCAICSIEGSGPAKDIKTGANRVAAKVKLESFRSHPYDPALRQKLLHPEKITIRELAELHAEVGDAFAEALHRTLVLSGIPEESIDLAGSHGQTIYHHSGFRDDHGGAAPKVTLQIGDGDRIAEKTGFIVISDFRARDVAAGGEGAPLTPYADAILFPPLPPSEGRRVVLNLGGIGNITILDADPRKIVAFDTGPANAPLDRLARIITKGEFHCDFDGRLAAAGEVNEALLAELLKHPFLQKMPPKSTGTEMFGDSFVKTLVAAHGAQLDLKAMRDLIATLTAFAAESVAFSLRELAPRMLSNSDANVAEVVVAGGGSHNKTLITKLRAALAPARVVVSDELGVPSAAREAMAFAILANDALLGLPTSLPRVTGSTHPVTLGKLSFPTP